MLTQGMLWEEQGILGIGQKGEETYGRRHFLELLSVFLSPPLFAVLHGRQELGFVDELTFLGKQEGPRVLLLGGRAWHVTHIDWQRKVAHVEASEDRGRTRWKGTSQGLSFRLCQAIKRVLVEDKTRVWWSQRAQNRLREIRGEYAWLRPEGSVVVVNLDRGTEWWTFAGYERMPVLRHLSPRLQTKRFHTTVLRFELKSHCCQTRLNVPCINYGHRRLPNSCQ